MEAPPAGLKQRQGFTLVEVLMAVALSAVVMGLAWVLMDSTRKVAREIEQPVEDPFAPLWQELQTAADRLLSHPVSPKDPPLRFSEENGLEMVALLPDANGIPQQTGLHYFIQNQSLYRIRRTGFPPSAQTNLLSNAVARFAAAVPAADEVIREWPPKKNSPLPLRLQVEISPTDGPAVRQEFLIPAALRVKKTSDADPASED